MGLFEILSFMNSHELFVPTIGFFVCFIIPLLHHLGLIYVNSHERKEFYFFAVLFFIWCIGCYYGIFRWAP
ncbi:hypothetical protein [Methanobrevibacter sp.]|uniref:hypothetical protein n=1 Tax=Methanobrevibacter sp. TaxID=66852 RepID=UPI003890AE99